MTATGRGTYLREHFSLEDRNALLGGRGKYYGPIRSVAVQVNQEGWLRSFLDEPDFETWEASHGSPGLGQLLISAETCRHAKRLLQLLMESAEHADTPFP